MKNGKKNSAILFASAALLLGLSGCATVKIPNQEITVDAGDFGADAFYSHTNDERHLTPAQWKRERFGQFCFKPRGFGALQAALKSLCDETNRCDRETIKFKEDLEKKVQRAMNRTNRYQQALTTLGLGDEYEIDAELN